MFSRSLSCCSRAEPNTDLETENFSYQLHSFYHATFVFLIVKYLSKLFHVELILNKAKNFVCFFYGNGCCILNYILG